MNIPRVLRGSREEVNPVIDRLLLASSGATKIKGGPIYEAPGVVCVPSGHSATYLLPINPEKAEFMAVDAGADRRARNIKRMLAMMMSPAAEPKPEEMDLLYMADVNEQVRNTERTITAIEVDPVETALRAILVTHGHIDHTAGLGAFPKATIYASEEASRYVQGYARAEGKLGKLLGRLPEKSRPLQGVKILENDIEEIVIGDRLVRAYRSDAHVPGSVVYVVDGCLFVGDEMYFNKDGGVSLSPEFVSHNTQDAAASLAKLVDTLDEHGERVVTVIPAHSDVGSMDALRQWREDQRKRIA